MILTESPFVNSGLVIWVQGGQDTWGSVLFGAP